MSAFTHTGSLLARITPPTPPSRRPISSTARAGQRPDLSERWRRAAERPGEPEEHRFAGGVPGELPRREGVLDRGGPGPVPGGGRDETFAETAGRRPAEIAAQPPRRPAVVG